MKTHRYFTYLPAGLAAALTVIASISPAAPNDHARLPRGPRIVDRGPHHRTLETVHTHTNDLGQVFRQTNTFTELAVGLHYREGNAWAESAATIEPDAQGARALHGPHQVTFKSNAHAQGAFQIALPDGGELRGHVLGLAFVDTASGRSAWIGLTRRTQAEILPPNQLIHADAFDDIAADIVYTYTRSGLRQDIVLREKPSREPEDFGLDPATTELQAITEFIDPPQPRRRSSTGKAPDDEDDAVLDFGAMHMHRGRAFAIGAVRPGDAGPDAAQGIAVKKSWRRIGSRTVLAESVPWPAVRPAIRALPQGRAALPDAGNLPGERSRSSSALARAELILPQVPQAAPRTLAQARFGDVQRASQAGFVLDFDLTGRVLNQRFQQGQTYVVHGEVHLDGTTTFEPGTTVKFDRSYPRLVLLGPAVFPPSGSSAAVFTAIDDNTVGAMVNGNPGSIPNGYYADRALWIYYPAAPLNVSGLLFKHCQTAVHFDGNGPQTTYANVSNCRFENCGTAILNNSCGISTSSLSACRVTTPKTGTGNHTFSGSAVSVDLSCPTPPANLAPNADITYPLEDSLFSAPATLTLRAAASDPDGTVAKVEFIINGSVVGQATTSPYTLPWTFTYPGVFSLSAKVTDQGGVSSLSTTVQIQVEPPPGTTTSVPPPPATNPAYLNLNFGGAITPDYIKMGLAATGATANDFWNNIPHQTYGPFVLYWADTTLSPVTLTAENTPGIWALDDPDRMYAIYVYSHSSPIILTFSGLPEGGYDFYLYGHGAAESQGSAFDLAVGGLPQGRKLTASSGSYNNLPWEEGRQYAVFRDVWVNQAAPVTLTVQPSGSAFSIINGLQIVRKPSPNSPPTVALVTPSTGTTLQAPTSVALASSAFDSDGRILRVDYYAGQLKLGEALTLPWQYLWTNAAAGTHQITVRAIDNAGAIATTTPTTITILPSTTSEPGLVGHWRLDETTGIGIADSSGANHTGQHRNNPTWTQGRDGGALRFDGQDDHAVVTDSPWLRLPGDMTLAFWVLREGTPGDWSRLVGKGGYHYRDYGLWMYPYDGQLLFQQTDANRNFIVQLGSARRLGIGTWTHLAVTISGSIVQLYWNGVLDAQVQRPGPPVVTAEDLTFAYAGMHSPFAGTLDDIRLYNRALSATEVRTIMDAADADRDGLPDNWELQHFGNLTQSPHGDWDADGITNAAEYKSGGAPAAQNELHVYTALR